MTRPFFHHCCEADAEAIRNAPDGSYVSIDEPADLRTALIARLGEDRYDLMRKAAADYLGIDPECEPEFVDRVIADGLEDFDKPKAGVK